MQAFVLAVIFFFTRQQSYRKVLRSSFFLSRHAAPRTTLRSQVHLFSSFRRFAPVLHIPYKVGPSIAVINRCGIIPRLPAEDTARCHPLPCKCAPATRAPYRRHLPRERLPALVRTFARFRLSYPARRGINHPPFRSASGWLLLASSPTPPATRLPARSLRVRRFPT